MKPKVFVAQPVAESALAILREAAEVTVYPYLDRQITTAELVAAAKVADWLFFASDNIVPIEVMDANPKLKGIGTVSRIGLHIDMAAAATRRLAVVSADPALFPGDDPDPALRGGVSLATADLTIGMLIALAYRIVESHDFTRNGHFKQEQTLALMGVGCPGKTVGLIGLGKVAQHMVSRIRAFEMNVLYTKRSRLPVEEEQARGLEWTADLDDLLRRSDFVCVECDYNEKTHKLIGARELGLMKPTAYLLNTARGRIVDEPALIKALQDGTIAGAGLDVYWNEPPVTYDPFVPKELCKLDNVILAPHNGGATWGVRAPRQAAVASSIVGMIRGEKVGGLINPEIFAEA